MTLIEAISYVDEHKPNKYSVQIKTDWLSRLDLRIFREFPNVFGKDCADSLRYLAHTDASRELLAPRPYDEVYRYWLEAQIDYHNADIPSYNNSIGMFNAAYRRLWGYLNGGRGSVGSVFRYF